MNRQKKSLLNQTYRKFLRIGLSLDDAKGLRAIVDKQLMGFGTTADEKVMNFEEIRELVRQQKKQSKGMDLQWKIKPLSHYTSEDENTAVYADELFLKVNSGEGIVKMYLRFSIILTYINDQWKVIHWHGSKPENVQSNEDTFGIDKLRKKTDELEKLVQEKTNDLVIKNRELEIEAALERVRSRSLAMHRTSELQEVIHVVHKELLHLKLSIDGGSFVVINDDIKTVLRCWGSGGTANTSEEVALPPYKKPFLTNLIIGIKKGPGFFTEEFSQREKKDFFTFLFKHKPWSALSTKQKKETLSAPGGYTRSVAVSLYTSIVIINHQGKKFSDAENDILKRFAKVFEQTYTRFLDLQKAEAQVREAQVEAALEKVRSSSLAMHRSDEMQGVVNMVIDQLKNLNIVLDTTNILIFNNDDKSIDFWTGSNSTGTQLTTSWKVPYFDILYYKKIWAVKESGQDLFSASYSFKEKNKIFTLLFSNSDFKNLNTQRKQFILKSPRATIVAAIAKDTAIQVISYSRESFLVEEIGILKRFSKVFSQAYTRFLDLQKAETQAREAQIEAALEKVRSRSLAMQTPEELIEVAELLRKEMGQLGVEELETSSIYIIGENDTAECWYAIKDIRDEHTKLVSDEMTLKLSNTWVGKEMWKFYQSKKEQVSILMQGDNRKEWISYCAGCSKVLQGYYSGQIPERTYHLVKFNGGYMGAASPGVISTESWDLLKRAATVFSLAYTRFKDLQDAAARSRETQIELALERVRSRSMAMHKSDELKEVIRLVLQQFVHLHINAEHAGFYIDYKAQDDMHIWLADPNLEPFFAVLPYFDTPTWNSFREAKAKGTALHTDLLDFEEKNKFYNSLFKLFNVPEEAKQFYMQCKGLAVSTVLLDSVGLYIENFEGTPYSDEENNVLLRFGKVFQQTYTRFLDLQKAEAQAREGQIQLALERVRARTMAMQKSDELLPTAEIMFDQLKLLGAELQGVAFAICDKNSTMVQKWTSIGNFSHPYDIEPGEQRMYEAWKNQSGMYEEVYEGEKQKKYYEKFMEIPEFRKGLQKVIDLGVPIPTWQKNYAVPFKNGYVLFIITKPFEETQIFLRFGNVFEQTYTRFLDLQKAEAQAREAQIEAGLERVRSRAMAMQTSEELNPLIGTVFTELSKLDVSLTRCAIVIYEADGKGSRQFMLNAETASEPMSFFVTHADIPYLNAFVKAWKERTVKWEYVLQGDDKFITDEFLLKQTELSQLPDFVIDAMRAPEKVHISASFNNFGCVTLASLDPLPDEHFDILLRFAKVFDLSYTRFNDLQVAEAQAREAQIEVALERVRTVALSMKRSEEMLDIAQSLYEQLLELGFANIRNAIIDLHNSSNETFMDYDYSPEMGRTVTQMSYYDHPFIEKQVRQTEASSDAFFELILEGKDLQDLIDVRLKNGEEDDPRLRKIKQLTYNLYSFGNGSIGISNFGLLSEEHKLVLKRFRNVFAFAFQRYTDMAQAEEQAREAQIEAALERVRSRTLAMQQSEELSETSAVLFKQLIELGIAPNRLFICIVNNGNGDAEFWITDEDGSKVSMAYKNNLNSNPSLKKMFVGWQQQQKSLVIDMKDNELQQYFNYLSSIHVPFKGGLTQKRRLQYLAYFSKGFIGMASPEEQPEETVQLLERFAGVFNLTFTRFNDLKVAEAHAVQAEQDLIDIKAARKKAEEALTELQSTQKQLIQSEKMASLGELTAGIAHEIQNPLNFVNNFSEVSAELIDEMKEELSKSNYEDANTIADDLKQNLEKISHHGKRAGDIVKGMLQHSRKSEGKKEPTDINALCDEYLRLAYHGLRAKDKTFNAEMKTNFDGTIGKINVVPQDIGRVILNLITNAFYAVSEKIKLGIENYQPLVSIQTKKSSDKIEISVSDNGNGIPKNIVDKIFQPFFTTKPTGSGTGLGLSLSYDIVKAHGGEIKVETKEGEGTEFVILL